MIDNFLNQPVFREEFGSAEQWLAGMNDAALDYTVQYCMALPSDLLFSLEMDAVTNYRARCDFSRRIRISYFEESEFPIFKNPDLLSGILISY